MLKYSQVIWVYFFICIGMVIVSCSGTADKGRQVAKDINSLPSETETPTEKVSKKEEKLMAKLKKSLKVPEPQWDNIYRAFNNVKKNATIPDLNLLIYLTEVAIKGSKIDKDKVDQNILGKDYIKAFQKVCQSFGLLDTADKNYSNTILSYILKILNSFKQSKERQEEDKGKQEVS